MSKDLAKLFPTDRAFTEIEAVFSLQLDHNNGKAVSILGYSKRWKWTRDKVSHFLKKCGLEIEYPEDTRRVKKQLGKLKTPAYQPTYNPHIKFIDFNKLHGNTHIKPAYQPAQLTRKEKEKKNATQKDPRVRVFIDWFKEKFKIKFTREYQIANHAQTHAQVKNLLRLNLGWEDLQFLTIEFLLDDDPFLQKAGHDIGQLLWKVGKNCYSKYLDPEFRNDNALHIIEEPPPSGKRQRGSLFESMEQR